MADRHQLEQAIAAQEGLRGVVPDDVVDVAIGALRQQLNAVDATTPRRRQATVLFADLSGFTAMSERVDAELVAATMNRLWERVDSVIVGLGGRIDKHIGDAVMAVNILCDLARVGVLAGDDRAARRFLHDALELAIAIGPASRALDCLIVEAERRFAIGDDDGGLALAGLVSNHPGAVSTTKLAVEQTLARSGLPTEEIEAAMAAGRDLELDTTADRVLVELRPGPADGTEPTAAGTLHSGRRP